MLVRFHVPSKARWATVAQKTTGLGEHLTDAARAVARENPRLSGVIDVTDFNATVAGQRIVDNGRLSALVQVLKQALSQSNTSSLEVYWVIWQDGNQTSAMSYHLADCNLVAQGSPLALQSR